MEPLFIPNKGSKVCPRARRCPIATYSSSAKRTQQWLTLMVRVLHRQLVPWGRSFPWATFPKHALRPKRAMRYYFKCSRHFHIRKDLGALLHPSAGVDQSTRTLPRPLFTTASMPQLCSKKMMKKMIKKMMKKKAERPWSSIYIRVFAVNGTTLEPLRIPTLPRRARHTAHRRSDHSSPG